MPACACACVCVSVSALFRFHRCFMVRAISLKKHVRRAIVRTIYVPKTIDPARTVQMHPTKCIFRFYSINDDIPGKPEIDV